MKTIEKHTIEFLADLKENNTREFMQDNKKRYQAAKKNAEEFVAALIDRLADLEPALMLLEPKDVMFRLHRDVRFSKDKTPYKIHFSAAISVGGKKVRPLDFIFKFLQISFG